ncbi:MAG: sensor histidine kinase [Ruminococcus sp.]
MLTAFDIITTIIDDVLGILFISKFYPFRDKMNIRIPICIGILIAHSILNVYLIYHMYVLKNMSFIAAFVLCTVIMLKCDKFKYLLLNALCVSIDYMSETLSVLLVAASRHKSLFALADSGELKTSMYLLSILIVLILYFLLDMIVRRKQEKLTFDNKLLSSYEVISFLIIVVLQIIIIFGLASVFPDEQLNTFLGIFSVGFCVLNFGLYFMFTRLADARRIEHENQLMKQQSEMQLKAYEGLSEQYNESLRIVHDMRKHIRSLDTLIENSSNKAAEEYQQTLYAELNRFYPNFRNDNQMLSVIINNEIAKAKRLGIEMQINIEKIDLNFISAIDMTTIFSNLIDNAIEACTEVLDKKCIKISMMQQMNFITVNIRNPYSRIDRTDDSFRSTKEGHFGIGLENVRKAIKTYNGTLNIKTNDGIFAVTVIIPIS